jgi:uncharacterized protein (DUF1499 family)
MELNVSIRRNLALVMVAMLVAAIAGVFTIGPEHVLERPGDPDLGPVSFETLSRRTTPNDALACPVGLCRAAPDIVSPIFPMPAEALRQVFTTTVLAEPRVAQIASDNMNLTDRYIQRTRWLAFPDTIVVRFLDLPGGRSTLAIYSRSKFGRSDFGVNLRRLKSWMARLAAYVPPVPDVSQQD